MASNNDNNNNNNNYYYYYYLAHRLINSLTNSLSGIVPVSLLITPRYSLALTAHIGWLVSWLLLPATAETGSLCYQLHHVASNLTMRQ